MKFNILDAVRLGVFGICPPCIDETNYPNYMCDPCEAIVQAAGLKGWVAKKCSYTFVDITDEAEWDAAIANKTVFGRVNGNRILGASPEADATEKNRGSCGVPEVTKYMRTVTMTDSENDAAFSINDIYIFLRKNYSGYDFAFIGCDDNLIGFWGNVSAKCSIDIPETNEDDKTWKASFVFKEDIDAFPEYQLDFLQAKQIWVCFVTSIVVSGAGAAITVVNAATLQMSAAVLPLNPGIGTVTWSVVPGTGSATISVGGLLTATGVGTVTVVATADDASGIVGQLEITVTV
jgi:hypothetical protein